MELRNYQKDGANPQAKAVLAYLEYYDEIQESWDEKRKEYTANIQIGRWENCREQGYAVSLVGENYKSQLNIAFFEHRNSDKICAIKWEENPTLNTPTITTSNFNGKYKDKSDIDFEVESGKAFEMAEWIGKELSNFWNENKKQ